MDILTTEVIVRNTELDVRNQNIRNWYENGGLGLFLDLYEQTGTLEAHNVALNSRPVMNFIGTYTAEQAIDLDTMEVIFTDHADFPDEPEVRMPITAKITHNVTGEVIYHSLMSTSFVFRKNEDGSVTSLYLD